MLHESTRQFYSLHYNSMAVISVVKTIPIAHWFIINDVEDSSSSAATQETVPRAFVKFCSIEQICESEHESGPLHFWNQDKSVTREQ